MAATAAEIEIPHDVAMRGEAAVLRYLDMLDNGESPRMAEMLALQWAPRVETDNTFMADCRAGHDDGLVGDSAMKFRKMYQKATGSMPDGKFYHSQLARFPGDPQAWVGSRGDIRRICEQRGLGFSGAVEVKAREVAPKEEPKEYQVAPDIVHKKLRKMEEANPGSVTTLSKREKTDLFVKTRKKLSGRQ